MNRKVKGVEKKTHSVQKQQIPIFFLGNNGNNNFIKI